MRLGASRRGATAVEFAVVGAPFLFLLWCVLELALVFIVGVNLSNATAGEARQIRVGSVKASGVSVTTSSGIQIDLADMKTAICNQIVLVPVATCVNQLQIDVRTMSNFTGSAPTSPISGSTFNASNLCYYSGGPGDIVEMRAYYLWTLDNPLLLSSMANITTMTTGNGSSTGDWVVISDTEVMKTEAVPGLSNTGSGC